MIYAKLLDEIDEAWSIDQKVLFLTERICQESCFDVRVIYLRDDVELHKKIYHGIKNIDVDEDNRIVCNTGNHLLKSLLDRINVNSMIVYTGTPENLSTENPAFPVSALIYQDENGNYKVVNVVGSITLCKLNLPPKFFGVGQEKLKYYNIPVPISRIEKEELERMCQDLRL